MLSASQRYSADRVEANRYLYVGDDPINLIDPSGQDILGLGGAYKLGKCLFALGTFAAGNTFLLAKIRKLGGSRTARRRQAAILTFFAEGTGLSGVIDNCGAVI